MLDVKNVAKIAMHLELLAQAGVVGNATQIIENIFREEIAKTVMKTFRTACDPWGITVERVEVGGNFKYQGATR